MGKKGGNCPLFGKPLPEIVTKKNTHTHTLTVGKHMKKVVNKIEMRIGNILK